MKLPIILSFYDYHDIDEFYRNARKIIPRLKAEEIEAFSSSDGFYYHAVFYLRKDSDYKKLVKKHTKSAMGNDF